MWLGGGAECDLSVVRDYLFLHLTGNVSHGSLLKMQNHRFPLEQDPWEIHMYSQV